MQQVRMAVIGLGYVGLPLAVEFARRYPVVGFDINTRRVEGLKGGHDATLEVSDDQLRGSALRFTSDPEEIRSCNVYIVTVPTPITADKRPDMAPLLSASATVGGVLSPGDTVIYESTVYPGATEEVCVPELERASGLVFNRDFFVGYSPERINPGDKQHTFATIRKVTSGSTPQTADFVDALYNSVLRNGTFKASSLKVAEASKIIENCQRDINISFFNELALIFDRLDIDTKEVIEAAATKWNFIKLMPGLVGGHCIGVDPYYLKWKAEQVGYLTAVISSGRRVNDSMGAFVADKVVKLLIGHDFKVKNAKVLVLGITFKENCPDIRNTKVVDVVNELREFQCDVDVYDPWASAEEVRREYGISLLPGLDAAGGRYDAVVLAVAHRQFLETDIRQLLSGPTAVVYDIKGVLPKEIITARL
ncbi:nucleotide sugar dehydrogenase [Rikenella microfusus]|uniref:UDP-glucose 6-dehydrogenase tuaD n=1 Tax=Rikenella microfusus TaxID=28139 RepID=A0A379MRJ1_9BACT|nr:nucleotide sugar dehydrogenase [Rikenella microfusus]SUE33379.1 UDP-glucose 6-dehydrogenase tuaD [Rikenella microfusus]